MRLLSVALASLTLATGCTMLMKSMTPKPRIVANPIASGQPLEVTKKASLGVITEQDCSIWPFEDTLSVAVTEAQICISQRKHVEASPGWTGEPTANRTEGFRVANQANEGGYISTEKARAAKVAQCFNKGYNKTVSIWAFDYKGCAPNNGTITATTTSVRIGNESWEFQPAGGAPATAAVP